MNSSKKNNLVYYYIPFKNKIDNSDIFKIDDALNSIDEIDAFNFEKNKQRIRLTSKQPNKAILKAVVKLTNLRIEIPIIKNNFILMNLHCASCANSSQNILKMQPGVISASVNYANEIAYIEYIPSIITTEKLKECLQEAGYDLIINENEDSQNLWEETQKKHHDTLKKKTIGAMLFSIPLLIIGMIPSLMQKNWLNYVMWLLATPVVFIFGRQFFIGAYNQAKRGTSNMDSLVAISTGTAYIFSIFNTLFPSFWIKRGLESHVYFEASATVIAFVLLGKILEEKAKGNTSFAIKKLIGLQPKTVTVIQESKQDEIPIKSVITGMTILVKPGEKIAVDGTIISGNSYVDESMISGEPIPIEKSKGSFVFAGTINQKGSFQFRAEKVGKDTLLSQIIQTVQEAQGSKAPVQKLVDKVASIFVPTVFMIASLSMLIWIIFGGNKGFIYGFQSFVTVLVIACPCALGLATPTAIMVGIGKGAEKGILIKDAESLEITKNINTIVMDKTGTITEGKPQVQDFKWFISNNDFEKNLIYSIEQSSEHPLAGAIVSFLNDKNVSFISDIKITNVSGQGIVGIYQNKKYFIGNYSLLNTNNILISDEVKHWMDKKLIQATTAILFANENGILAGISISDKIKSTSQNAISQIKMSGIEVHMLTGDNNETAEYVANNTGINIYKAEVSPQDKIDYVKKLQASPNSKIVAMVGDGINDSAALAQADVSIAMGHGSDIALDVSKMTIISGDLLKIPIAIKLSKQTVKTIKQNLFWAFIYNIIGIPIAAGILYPINNFLLNPMIAGAAMALSSVSVVSNSLLLKLKN
jgi:P-type Cu2+ transporter